MNWLVVRSKAERGAARFSHIQNYEEDHQLSNAVPLKDTFAADAEVRMKPDFPNDIEVVDSLASARAYLIVNQKVCQLFERAGVKNVEFLPIAVINHKKKAVKDPYFVVNILSHVDCIDLAQSTGVGWNAIDPSMMDSIQQMVLDPARLPKDLKTFRPTNMKYIMLIERSLAEEIQAAKLRGFSFEEIDEFSE